MARVASLEGGGEGGGFGGGGEGGVPAGEGDVLGGDGSVAGFLDEVEAGRVVEFHVGTLEVLAVEGEEGALGDEGGGGVDVVGNADVREVLAQGEGLGGDGGGVGQEREGFDGLPTSLIRALTKCFPVEPYPFVSKSRYYFLHFLHSISWVKFTLYSLPILLSIVRSSC